MAAHEACANVVEHAYGPSGGIVTITATHHGEHVEVRIRIRARGEDPRGATVGTGYD